GGPADPAPACPVVSQDCPGGQKGSAQQVSSTQLPDMQSVGVLQAPPFGTAVGVIVTVGVLVTVAVDVTVGVIVTVGVLVTVAVDMTVGVVVTVGGGEGGG